ncbi:MAG: hypothetical protein U0L49_00085 [Eubacterium sp.]|nr:hypothetical protein [Eubacterium sp.]
MINGLPDEAKMTVKMEKVIYLDCENMTECDKAFGYLAEKLDAATLYGSKSDALRDFLMGLGSSRIVLLNTRALDDCGTYGKELLDAFADAADGNPSLTLEFYRTGRENFRKLKAENASCSILDRQLQEKCSCQKDQRSG